MKQRWLLKKGCLLQLCHWPHFWRTFLEVHLKVIEVIWRSCNSWCWLINDHRHSFARCWVMASKMDSRKFQHHGQLLHAHGTRFGRVPATLTTTRVPVRYSQLGRRATPDVTPVNDFIFLYTSSGRFHSNWTAWSWTAQGHLFPGHSWCDLTNWKGSHYAVHHSTHHVK